MVVLASGVAAYAFAVVLIHGFGAPFVAGRRATFPVAVTLHLLGGAVALAVGAWQLNAALRTRRPVLHRWMGRIYVGAVAVGAYGAGVLAPVSEHGMVTHLGFGLLAVLWFLTTMAAWVRIREGNTSAHRRWMLRSYALTFAAVTLRIWLPLTQIIGLPFPESYQVISWFCWVPNLLVVELLAVRRPDVVPVTLPV